MVSKLLAGSIARKRAIAVRSLGGFLGLPVARILQYRTGNGALFIVEVANRDGPSWIIPLGGREALGSRKLWARKIFKMTGREIGPFKNEDWVQIVRHIHDSIEIVVIEW